MPRLRRSNCATPGIARRRRGRGFEYLGPDGDRVADAAVLERIAALSVPPAWREVWICGDALGHLQATGLDAAGRKQYIYHERWRAHRDRLKFESMLAFARALPGLRRRVARDLGSAREDGSAGLAAAELTQARILACAVRLLDLGFFRIGSEDYAEQNGSFGLSTMRREHVTIAGNEIVFDFPAKSGQRRVQAITDEDALRVIAALKRRRVGSQLLAYRTTDGWADLRAEEVNSYIKGHAAGDFTAKDFRTWNATVLAAVALAAVDVSAGAERTRGRAARERIASSAIKTVASYLGNTPAVCRSSYVDPRVIDRYHAGVTIAAGLAAIPPGGPDLADSRLRRRIERAVLELLDDAPPSAASSRRASAAR
jgi:DNA topoisomerase I